MTRAGVQPSVSVLLPAWNEGATLGRCLDAFAALDWPELEVIVCAGGRDGTAEIARTYVERYPERFTVIEQASGEGKQAALRRSYALAAGSVIYLTDADCVVPVETFEQLVEAVGPDGADATTGPAEPFPEQRESSWVRHQWATVRAVDRARPRESNGILGRNCAVRRDAVDAAGAFDEPVRIGTDYHFAKMLIATGRTIHFVAAPVQTHYAEHFGDYLGQQSRWLRNILLHGPRFDAGPEIVSVMRTIGLGTSLLIWPLTWRWTKRPGVVIWLLPMGWMTLVRIQQQRALESEIGLSPAPAPALVARSMLYSIADLVVWARPVFDLLDPRRRFQW
jgi:cellulose synthase/poly-beta-1,6-N-acetylglucosamine synthase-like glycosyltransferase